MNKKQTPIINQWEEDPEVKEQLRKLTEARIRVLPREVRISIGSSEYSPSELIKHIIKEDEVGQQIMRIQLEFLQDLAKGAIYEENG
jgi:hypothetical protein